jgi:hypothetical protein
MNRITKLRATNHKICHLLQKIQVLRAEAIEIHYIILDYNNYCWLNNNQEKSLKKRETEHTKLRKKINKLITKLNELNSDRRILLVNPKTKQLRLF